MYKNTILHLKINQFFFRKNDLSMNFEKSSSLFFCFRRTLFGVYDYLHTRSGVQVLLDNIYAYSLCMSLIDFVILKCS